MCKNTKLDHDCKHTVDEDTQAKMCTCVLKALRVHVKNEMKAHTQISCMVYNGHIHR